MYGHFDGIGIARRSGKCVNTHFEPRKLGPFLDRCGTQLSVGGSNLKDLV